MTKLITREDVFKLNRVFASFIVEQQSSYAPHADHLYTPEREYFDWDKQVVRYYTKHECDELNLRWAEDHERKRDKAEVISLTEFYAGSAYFVLPETDMNEYIDSLGEGLALLARKLNWESLFFMLDYKVSWYEEDNDYDPLSKSIDYLKSISVYNEYTGGVNVSISALPEFIRSYFWLDRCNTSTAYSYFSAPGINLVMHLCKYGNFHFFFYSEDYKKEVCQQAAAAGLIITKNCYEAFSNSDEMKGRQLKWMGRKW